MPIKQNSSKIILLCCLGLSLGHAGMWALEKYSPLKRQPSSVSMGKSAKFHPMPLGKHLTVISAEIEKLEQIPDTADQEVTLTGIIYVRQQIYGDVGYKWTLPPEVKVVDGQTSDSFADVKAGEAIKVKLSVTGFSKEMQSMISLQAFAHQDGIQIGGSAVTVSRPEETWEAVAPEMKTSAEEQLQEAAVKITK